MMKLEKKQVKIVSVIIALVFIGSVVALALTQSGGIASAAPSSTVGVVDMQQVMMQHPDRQSAEEQLKATVEEVEKNFKEKEPGLTTDQEKADFYMQSQQIIANRESELSEQLLKKVEEAVKQTADARGLSIVVAKAAVVYGGTDITQDVITKLTKK